MDNTISQSIGLPLSNLLKRLGLSPIQAQEITGLAANSVRSKAFRLDLPDNVSLKGRYYKSEAAARVSQRIHGVAGLTFLPELIGVEGAAMIERWIEGRDLAESAPTPEEIRRAGTMLGKLHASPVPPMDDLIFTPLDADGFVVNLRRRLEALTQAGVVDAILAGQILDRVMLDVPVQSPTGIVHRDLCPQNIVRDRRGDLYLIDNGLLTLGPFQEDLCRTRYRWPMNDQELQWFAEGYSQYRDPADFLAPSIFWWNCVLVSGAYTHMLSGSPKVQGIVRQIVDHLRRIQENPS